jgi:hypothetical protein
MPGTPQAASEDKENVGLFPNVPVAESQVSRGLKGWKTKLLKKEAADKENLVKGGVLEEAIRLRTKLHAEVLEYHQAHLSESVRDIGKRFGLGKSNVNRIINGKVARDTTPNGGRPPKLSKELVKHLGKLVVDSGNVLTCADVLDLAVTSFCSDPANADKEPPKSSKYLLKKVQKECPELNVRTRLPKAGEKARENACSPSNLYYGAMEIKVALEKLSRLRGRSDGVVESHCVHFVDEMMMSEGQGDASSQKTVGTAAMRTQNATCSPHVSSATFFAGSGSIILTVNVIAGSPLVTLDGPGPPPFDGLVIYTTTGSVKKAPRDTPEVVSSWSYMITGYLAQVERMYGDVETRGWMILIMDLAPCHDETNTFGVLLDNKVMVVRVRAHTSGVAQISDSHHLHGNLAKIKRAQASILSRSNQGSLDIIDQICNFESMQRQAFSPSNIRAAIEGYVFRYVPDQKYKLFTVTDATALAWLQKKADKGDFDRHLTLEEARDLRADRTILLNRLIANEAVSPNTRDLVSDRSIAAMNARRVEINQARQILITSKAKSKKTRRVALPGIVIDHKVIAEDTVMLNTPTIIAQRKELQAQHVREVEEKTRKRQRRTEDAATKSLQRLARTEREQKLRERFKDVDAGTYAQVLKSVGRYFTAKAPEFDFEWAVGKVQKKLGHTVTNTTAADSSKPKKRSLEGKVEPAKKRKKTKKAV